MAVFKTCRSCALSKAACARRHGLSQAMRGHNVASLTHRCPDYRGIYHQGQAVWAQVFDAPHTDEYHAELTWFPAVFLAAAKINTRGIVLIQSGAQARNGDGEDFFPVKERVAPNGGRYAVCKVLWERLQPREAEDEPICPYCGDVYRVTGCAYDDPVYHPCRMKTEGAPTDEVQALKDTAAPWVPEFEDDWVEF